MFLDDLHTQLVRNKFTIFFPPVNEPPLDFSCIRYKPWVSVKEMALSERTTQNPPEWDSRRLKESAEKRASSRPAPLCFSPGLWSLRRDCCHIFHLHRFGLMIQITVWEINVRTLKQAPLLVRVHGVPAHTERHMVVFNLRSDSKILRIKNSWLESMGYEIPPLHIHGQLKRKSELCFPASCTVAMLCKLQNVPTYDCFFSEVV